MTRDGLLLGLLRASATHVPPFHLAHEAELAPAEVDRCVEELCAAGFQIELRPGLGYKLLAGPDRLMADDLWARLTLGDPAHPSTSFVREIIVLEETHSTNDVAAQLGRDGAGGGAIVFAERQTGGRGRFGRRWESASHQGLWMSLLLRPLFPPAQWPRLTTWAAVAVAHALEQGTGCVTRIKWPNDVEMSGRKVAGLLAELGEDRHGRPFAVLGIGININQEAGDFPPDIAARATSLRLETGRRLDRAALAAALLQELAATEGLLEDHFEKIVTLAARRSSVLGQAIEARAGETIHRGLAEGLDADGHLLLRQANGEVLTLTAGEVTLSG
ncbi:MAG TPA: biotin--[acetyl-CoA-carboxylase] ligase [Chthoniobacteraceae bacterium]|jgi:BirA family biotin operon repressor/biotin-[acetyl-CoA-carboxylase] ligase|nr:biotin--[acetyl-CoA-carboxylase] ligase [Chthoniobacteraceae bacterium]